MKGQRIREVRSIYFVVAHVLKFKKVLKVMQTFLKDVKLLSNAKH